MHNNYKLDKQAITNSIKRHIKPIENQKQIKLIIYSTTLNLKLQTLLRITPYWKKNSYIGYTTTTLSRCLTYHLSENSTIKHLIIKHNSANQLTSSNVRKILTDNIITIYKNNNKKRSQILEAIYIKNKKPNINKIAFNTDTNILNILITKNH